MKLAALLASILLAFTFATAQACPYGSKGMRSTDATDYTKGYSQTAKSSGDQTLIKDKAPLDKGIATTVEPNDTAN